MTVLRHYVTAKYQQGVLGGAAYPGPVCPLTSLLSVPRTQGPDCSGPGQARPSLSCLLYIPAGQSQSPFRARTRLAPCCERRAALPALPNWGTAPWKRSVTGPTGLWPSGRKDTHRAAQAAGRAGRVRALVPDPGARTSQRQRNSGDWRACWRGSRLQPGPAGGPCGEAPVPRGRLTAEWTMNSQVFVKSLASRDRFMSQRRVYWRKSGGRNGMLGESALVLELQSKRKSIF